MEGNRIIKLEVEYNTQQIIEKLKAIGVNAPQLQALEGLPEKYKINLAEILAPGDISARCMLHLLAFGLCIAEAKAEQTI